MKSALCVVVICLLVGGSLDSKQRNELKSVVEQKLALVKSILQVDVEENIASIKHNQPQQFFTVRTLPKSSNVPVTVTDGMDANDCVEGNGTSTVWCYYDGLNWAPIMRK